ncbi:hypothetical protein BGX38DRAFT_1108745, partial [Terfezia claveryi]
HNTILYVRYITDFILIAQYKVHTSGTIQSMKDYLEDFHKYKELFLQFRASNGVHYNFPKIYLISHFVDQIAEYGSLPQFLTDICKALHKPLKDGYWRSNYVNAVPQVIHTHEHTISPCTRRILPNRSQSFPIYPMKYELSFI